MCGSILSTMIFSRSTRVEVTIQAWTSLSRACESQPWKSMCKASLTCPSLLLASLARCVIRLGSNWWPFEALWWMVTTQDPVARFSHASRRKHLFILESTDIRVGFQFIGNIIMSSAQAKRFHCCGELLSRRCSYCFTCALACYSKYFKQADR